MATTCELVSSLGWSKLQKKFAYQEICYSRTVFINALAFAASVALVGADGAAGRSIALGREDPAARRVADVNSAVRSRDTVLVATAPLARAASDRGGGQEANSDEDTSEVHFVFGLEGRLGFVFEVWNEL